jgi:hypothetical protein
MRPYDVVSLVKHAGKRRLAIALMTCAVLGACAASRPPRVQLSAPFDEADAQSRLQPGDNTISGHALPPGLAGSSLDFRVASVSLIPATPHAAERMRCEFHSDAEGSSNGDAIAFEPDHPGYARAMRATSADGQGRFRFSLVRDGEYFVVARTSWSAPSGTAGARSTTRQVYQRLPKGNQTAKLGTVAVAGGGGFSTFVTHVCLVMKRVAVSGGVVREIELRPQ